VAFGSLAMSDKVVLVIICIVVIAFGVYPQPLNEIAESAVKGILLNIK
jgi:NADH:ubiquinone oxidoreductase subunit 4 (subunit M)